MKKYLAKDAHHQLRPGQLPVMRDLLRFTEQSRVGGRVVLPTGAGKTVVFSKYIQATGLRSLVVVPTKELRNQTLERLKIDGLRVRSVSPYDREGGDEQVSVITYMGLVRAHRTSNGKYLVDPSKYGLLVLDEGHHALADGASEAISEFNSAFKLAFTASPDYSELKQLESLMPQLVHQISIPEAVSWGMISPVSNVVLRTGADLSNVQVLSTGEFDSKQLESAIDTERRNEKIASFYAETLKDEKAIFSCNTVDHALHIAYALRERGVRAEAIHGSMPAKERESLLKKFKAGELTVLANAKLLTEGFDDESVSVIVNVAPTLSTVRQPQRSGRAMRLDPLDVNKHAVVIDCLDEGYKRSPILFSHKQVAGSALLSNGPMSAHGVAILGKISAYTSEGLTVIIDPSEVEKLANTSTIPRPRVGQTASAGSASLHRSPPRYSSPMTYATYDNTEWQDDALCAQVDTEIFFPEKGQSTREAKKICNLCTVSKMCLQYALDNEERFGIWGGLSERERRIITASKLTKNELADKLDLIIDNARQNTQISQAPFIKQILGVSEADLQELQALEMAAESDSAA